MSVSTLMTTQTDRKIASKVAPVDVSVHGKRYTKLTSINTGDDVNLILSKSLGTKVKKQVREV